MKKPELLAPAGNFESLKAAISAGCDAVYLGGKLFGARTYATNFSDEQIIEAIKYAHIYGVKVYITVNTLIFEEETKKFLEYVEFLHKNSVDAIIMQDLGMIDLVHQTFPNLEIHASTQMNIHNIEAMKLAKKLGIKKIVLAREMSLNQIKKIKEQINTKLEVFIHGALCMSYSGQCLMSYFQGGRSGNRGSCAQCCRMPYDLIKDKKIINEEKYLLSPKDLCTLENIGKLIDLNIDSFKIEGRMKRPEYVYIVTKIYRMAIDQYIEKKEIKIKKREIEMLKKIFNRKFTKGFLFEENNSRFINAYRPNHMGIQVGKVIGINNHNAIIKLEKEVKLQDGIRILNQNKDIGCTIQTMYQNKKRITKAGSGDIIEILVEGNIKINDTVIKTTDFDEIQEIKHEILNNKRKVKIDIKLICNCDKNLKIEVTDGTNNISLTSDFICEHPKNYPTTKENIKHQIDRLKNTPYEINKLQIIMNKPVFIDIKKINELRREAVFLLSEKRCYKIPYKKEIYKREIMKTNFQRQLSVYLQNLNDKSLLNEKISTIYCDLEDKQVTLRLSNIMETFPNYNKQLLIGELGSLHKYKNFITDISFNVTNSYTVALLNNLGAKRVTLSYENTDDNISKIIKNYKQRYHTIPNLELVISSYPVVMTTKFNLLKKYNLKNSIVIKNKQNNYFKLIEKDQIVKIYFLKKEQRLDYKKYYKMQIESLRIELHDKEDLKLIKEISKYL